MPRKARPWFRAERNCYYAYVNGKQVPLHTADEAEAWERFREIASTRSLPKPIGNSPQVAMLLDRFLQNLDLTANERQTYKWYEWRLQSFLDSLADQAITVNQLKPFHLTEWLQAHPTWGSSMRRSAIRAVQRAMKWALEEGLIEKSPVAHVKKPPQGRRDFVFTPEQQRQLLEATDEHFRQYLVVASLTGARPEEMRTVEARHCTFDFSVWAFPVEDAKGHRKPRLVYLPAAAQEIVRELAQKHPAGPLFRNRNGVPWTTSAIVQRFARLRKKLGLPKGAVATALRHTFTTESLQKGLDVYTVAKLLGHTSTQMIERVYGHLKDDYLAQQAERAAS